MRGVITDARRTQADRRRALRGALLGAVGASRLISAAASTPEANRAVMFPEAARATDRSPTIGRQCPQHRLGPAGVDPPLSDGEGSRRAGSRAGPRRAGARRARRRLRRRAWLKSARRTNALALSLSSGGASR